MPETLMVPKRTAEIVEVEKDPRHPGLLLDKFCPLPPGVLPGQGPQGDETGQQHQRNCIQRVVQATGDQATLEVLFHRRRALLEAAGATSWVCESVGPFTLHLSRASALENAGLCLHPLYGFAYLPGSGLKGLARAYAETVWLRTQYRADSEGQPAGPEDERKATEAWHQIESVFGWAPGSDSLGKEGPKRWKPKCVPKRGGKGQDDRESAGSVVFYDAWPATWPKLHVDILNCHHHKYYNGDDDPGDWENPIPVYFLAVNPGTRFSFAISARRKDDSSARADLAREWLLGGLCHLGAGAKTNSGYGSFKPLGQDLPTFPEDCGRKVFETTLELVTPAFLAGADQKAEDCDLRPATLRGLLRWWWRTMHAGHLGRDHLRRLESAIWGDTAQGGAVQLQVRPIAGANPVLYDKKKAVQDHSLPKPRNQKTTQGLWYMTYGMHDGSKQRPFLPQGTKWSLRLLARPSELPDSGPRLSADEVYQEAVSALGLLCRFGGVGAKARKGWGSLQAAPESPASCFDLDAIRRNAQSLAERLGLPRGASASPAIGAHIPMEQVRLGSAEDVWKLLDLVGSAIQEFAQDHKHNLAKKALGLPRNVRPPFRGQFNSRLDRHSSPIHLKVARDDGGWVFRAIAFPSARLPDPGKSREFLADALVKYAANMTARAKPYIEQGVAKQAQIEEQERIKAATKEREDREAPLERTGVVASKKGVRDAMVRCDDGTEYAAGQAKRWIVGDRVIIKRGLMGKWDIDRRG